MIRFDNISKQFRMRYEDSRTFQSLFVNMLGKLSGTVTHSARPSTVKILENISFIVDRGEALGIIGPNGAGKSTILKLAAGIIYPDSGRIGIEGRVAGLLELGAGFHPDLSGRENIYLYGSIMGLSRKVIDARLTKIIEFADLSHFIDIPVKDYSSGMFMRLAFAVAVHVDAEVLLIDEVLSVGDAAFRQKSYRRILDYKAGGGAILFVSHELTTIERLCERVLLLHQGQIIAEGPPRQVIEKYLQLLRSPRQNGRDSHRPGAQPQVHIKAVRLYNGAGTPCHKFGSGSQALLRVWLEASASVSDLVVQVQIYSTDFAGVFTETMAHGTNSTRHSLSLDMPPGEICLEVAYQSLNLIPGSYYFRVGILPYEWATEYYDVWYSICPFEVSGSRELGAGLALLPHRWRKVDD